MKQSSLTKLYEDMTIRERVSLAFHHVVEHNSAELERISASVPHLNYRGIDLEFSRGIDRIMQMILCWSGTYWHMEAARWAVISKLQFKDNDADAFDALCSVESKLLALDEALDAVCDELGIAPDDARKVAETERAEVFSEKKSDTVYRYKMQAELLEIAMG